MNDEMNETNNNNNSIRPVANMNPVPGQDTADVNVVTTNGLMATKELKSSSAFLVNENPTPTEENLQTVAPTQPEVAQNVLDSVATSGALTQEVFSSQTSTLEQPFPLGQTNTNSADADLNLESVFVPSTNITLDQSEVATTQAPEGGVLFSSASPSTVKTRLLDDSQLKSAKAPINKKILFIFIGVFVAVLMLGVAGYFGYIYLMPSDNSANKTDKVVQDSVTTQDEDVFNMINPLNDIDLELSQLEADTLFEEKFNLETSL